VVDYVNRWTQRAELPTRQLLAWLGLGASKFHQWKNRYGKVNEHNALVPRDWWLEEWEKQAILAYHDRYPLNGYRRLAFMMLDNDVVAVRPTSVYRVLKQAGRLDRRGFSPSRMLRPTRRGARCRPAPIIGISTKAINPRGRTPRSARQHAI
jgi:hypothetical protein